MNKVLAILAIIISASSYGTTSDYVDKLLATYPTRAAISIKLGQHEFSCKDLIDGYIKRIKLYNITTLGNNVSLNA